jgi:hypothetical protein
MRGNNMNNHERTNGEDGGKASMMLESLVM